MKRLLFGCHVKIVCMNDIVSFIKCVMGILIFVVGFEGCHSLQKEASIELFKNFEDSVYTECMKESDDMGELTFSCVVTKDVFMNLLKLDTMSMSYPFQRLVEKGWLTINVSKDENLKIYSWQDARIVSRWGGVEYLVQYRTKDGKVQITEDLTSLLMADNNKEKAYLEGLNSVKLICTVTNHKGNSLYVLDFYGRADTQYGHHLIGVYQIDGDGIKCYKAFDGGKSSFTMVDYYGIADWYFRTGGLGWGWVNSYNENERAIYIPHFTDSDVMVDRYDIYKFDGSIFNIVRTDGGFWLNATIRKFIELKTLFRTKDYTIRVDSVGKGVYRYTSWKMNKTMSDVPDIVLFSSEYDVKKKCYVFYGKENNRYIVDDGYDNYREGKGLVVKKNNKTVLSQQRELFE